MARVPRVARPGEWQKPAARIEGDRLLKARQLEQRVRDQIMQAKAEAQRVEELAKADLKQEVDQLDGKLDELIDNLPKIVPGAGSGRKTIRKVIERDFPDFAMLEALSKADGNFVIGDGTKWTVESGATARTSLGLGSAAVANLLDEDDFASNSADAVPSQQSTKAYVDRRTPYSTIAALQAANVPPSVDHVVVAGFYNEGDCEEAIYLDRFTGLLPGTNLIRASNDVGVTTLWTTVAMDRVSKSLIVSEATGLRTLAKLTPTTANSGHQLNQSITYVSGKKYYHSAFVKANGYNFVRLSFPSGAFGTVSATFNVSTGTVSSVSGISAGNYGVIDYGSGIYRIWAAATATGSGAFNSSLQVGNNSGTFSFAGDGTSGVYAGGFAMDVDVPGTTITAYRRTIQAARTFRVTNGYVTSADGAVWRYSDQQMLTSKKFGAVCDGIDTGSAYTGTDDTVAIGSMIGFAAQGRRKCYISAGAHYIAHQSVNGGGYIDIDYDYVSVGGFGREVSRVYVDEDLTYYSEANGYLAALFDTGISVVAPYSRTKRSVSHWEDFSIRGRWSHSPGRYGVAFIRSVECADFKAENMGFYDGRSSAVRNSWNNSYTIKGCVLERAAGGFRAQETNNYIAIGNTVKWTDDDVFDHHTGSGVASIIGPLRTRTVIIGNHLTDTESGVIGLGARMTVVTGNTFTRVKGAPITVGYESVAEGSGSAFGNIIANNTIIDPIGRYESGSWGSNDSGAIIIAGSPRSSVTGVNNTTPGTWNSTVGAFELPWTVEGRTSAPLSGAMNIGPTGTYSSPGGMNMICSHNIIKRTMPDLAAWSSFDGGLYFSSHEGWLDPPVTSDTFRKHAIQLWGDLEGASVTHNQTHGIEIGLSFLVPGNITKDRKLSFKHIYVGQNSFVHCKRGVSKDNTGSNLALSSHDSWGVVIEDNFVSCDPYHQASFRKTGPIDGTWTSDSSFDYRAFVLYNMSGFILRNNTVEHCYDIVAENSDIHLQGTCVGNVIRCQPSAVGFSTSNKGVANVRRASAAWRYQIWDCTPGNSTYGRMLNSCVTQASAVPSTGTFVTGHFVENTATKSVSSDKILKGWERITVGSGTNVHPTASPDWYPIYDHVA